MIGKRYMAVCDICGHAELANFIFWHGEPLYDLPDGWAVSRVNNAVHLCPTCAKRLTVNKAITQTHDLTGDPAGDNARR